MALLPITLNPQNSAIDFNPLNQALDSYQNRLVENNRLNILSEQDRRAAELHPVQLRQHGLQADLAQEQLSNARETSGLARPHQQAQTDLARAHTQYYLNAGQALMRNSDVRQQNADTRRRTLDLDNFIDRLGPNPTAEQWNQENQPGGIIHSVFGGPQPYESAPSLVQQAQARRSALSNLPSEDDLAGAGFTPQQATNARRQAALRRLYGSPGPGHAWEMQGDGTVIARRLQEGGDSRNPVSPEQIDFNMANLGRAFGIISGTTDENGRLRDDGPGIVRRAIAQSRAGGYLTPELREAYESAGHAALTLSYALSGRQIGQAEQGRILGFFTPTWSDSPQIAAFKMEAAHSLFDRLRRARRGGAPDEARAQLFDSEMSRMARRLEQMQGAPDYRVEQARRMPENRQSVGKPGEPSAAPRPPQQELPLPTDDGFTIRRLD